MSKEVTRWLLVAAEGRVHGERGKMLCKCPFHPHFWGTRCPICHFTGMETFGLSLCEETGRNTQTGGRGAPGSREAVPSTQNSWWGASHCFIRRNFKTAVLLQTLTVKWRICPQIGFSSILPGVESISSSLLPAALPLPSQRRLGQHQWNPKWLVGLG